MSFLSARLRSGLSQAAVAERLGITAASVCQWETGKNLPRTSLLPNIAALYECTVDELLTQDSSDVPDVPALNEIVIAIKLTGASKKCG